MSVEQTGGGEGLQFDKVDLAAPDGARGCPICKRAIDGGGEYFEIAGNIICKSCAASLSGSKQGRGSLVRAGLFGLGAAVLGTIAWYAITKISGYQLGLVAIAVGLFVGRAVRKGGGGLGGWRYQALAMALTYVSITVASYVPLLIAEASEANAGRVAAELGLAFAAPFLGGASNFMGIVIIGIGLYEAWKINRRVPLSGPFRFGPATAGPGGGPPPTALP